MEAPSRDDPSAGFGLGFDETCRGLLADLCHEVRTPLHGILGTLELLMASDLPGDLSQLARDAYESTRGLHDVFEQQVATMFDHLSALATALDEDSSVS